MLCWIVITIVLILSIIITKTIIHPVSIFSLVWFIIMSLYQLNIGRLNQISSRTYFIIGSGVVSFALGYVISKYLINFKRIVVGSFRKKNTIKTEEMLRYGLIQFLCISSIVVLLPEAINSVKILASGGSFEALRINYSSGKSALNIAILMLYRNYIVKPFCYIIYPLCAIDFIKGERKKWLFLSTLIIALLSTLYEGGRVQFVYLAIHFLLISKLAGLHVKIPKSVKRSIVVLLILMIGVVLYITASRGSETTLAQSLLVYISGCVPLLDSHLKAVGFHPDYTFGLVAISGFLKPFFALLENIGVPYPIFLTNIQYVFEVEKTVSIGKLFHMNAYVSVFYYFFYDGGFLGNIIGLFLYGALAWLIYRRASSLRGMLYYALLFQGLLFSMIRFQFTISHYCLAFIMAYFLFQKIEPANVKEGIVCDC